MQKLTNSDILALIDDLNQYLNGNVTNDGLSESLTDLQYKLHGIRRKTYLSKCGKYEYTKQ